MAGIFLIDGVRRALHRRKREQKLARATQWPVTLAEINHWQILNADEDAVTMGAQFQIEAGFHFKINGEYFGGYLRSVAMGHHDAEMKAKGMPKVQVRYDPANPNAVAVLNGDNRAGLGFELISG